MLSRGHYDLLYQNPPHPGPISVQVNYATIEPVSCVTQDPFPLPDFTHNPVLMHLPLFTRGTLASANAFPTSAPTYAFPVVPSPPPVVQTPASPPQLSLSTSSGFNPGFSLVPEPNGADRPAELPIRINELVYKPMNTLPLSSISYRK
jgi:hypothetical protein